MMDIHYNARPDERFHLQKGVPWLDSFFDWKVIRRAVWYMEGGYFVSWWFFNHLQIYYGTRKCDGSRTRWAWSVGLAQPDEYVITTTPSEMHAFRWRRGGPVEPLWDRMGGA